MRLLATTALCLLALCVSTESALSVPVPETSPAARTLATCVQERHRLSVLVLMDTSGSLVETDPQNQRVEGLRAALAGLAHLAGNSAGGQAPIVDVLFLGFSSEVSPPLDKTHWQRVTQDALGSLDAQAGQYATQNHGRDTDYGTALLAARQLLAQHTFEQTRAGGPEPCKALIWFTDGSYEIADRIGATGLPITLSYAPGIKLDQEGAGKRATAAGKAFLCRPRKLMDGLASDGVVKFTVGLSEKMSAEDSAFLNGTTTGFGPGFRCGSQLSPRTGAYLPVAHSRKLFFAFGSLLEGSSAPITSSAACPLKPCERGSSSFTAVPGLDRFRIQASTGATGIEVVLRGPTGNAVHLAYEQAARALALPGASISERWLSSQTVEIEGDFSTSSSQWAGPWAFSFVAPQGGDTAAVPLSTIQLYADASPVLVGPYTLIRGEASKLTFALSQRSGQRAAVNSLTRSAVLAVDTTDPVTGHASRVVIAPEGEADLYGGTATVPIESEAPFLLVNAAVRFPLVDGVAVAPTEGAFRLPVRQPAREGYPTVAPLQLQLASVSGRSKTTGVLTMRASPDAAGCVWLGAAAIRTPEGVGSVSVTTAPAASSAASCIHLAKGESRRVEVTFEPARVATGTVRATLPIMLISTVTQGSRTVAIQATFALYPAPNVAKRIWLTVVLTLLGILIPVLLLHGLNVAGARFTEPQKLQWLAQDVVVDPSRGLQSVDGGQIKTRFGDFEEVSGQGLPHKERSLHIDRFELRTIPSGSLQDRVFGLLRGPYAVAESDGEPLLAGAPQPLRVWRDGAEHEVPLTLPGTWLFLPTYVPVRAEDGLMGEPGEAEPVAGRLLLLIADHDHHERGVELAQSAGVALRAYDWKSFNARPEPPRHSVGFLDRLFSRRTKDEEFPTIPGEEEASMLPDEADSWTDVGSAQDPPSDEPDPSSHIY
jgi:hypothetical protein